MRPLIGIPQCLDDGGRWRTGRTTQYLDRAYAQAIESADATPIFLPLQAETSELVARIDGLLLPGGDDFAPPRPYPDSVRFEVVPAAQLDFDRRLLDATLAAGIPILAICYGMQLLALHAGGALHHDIATDVPGAGEHRLPEDGPGHSIQLTAGSRLHRILGNRPDPVNSLHHQAVSDAGELRVAARSEDGLVEAVEAGGETFRVGVQWHPEKLEGAHRDRLMAAFVSACRRD